MSLVVIAFKLNSQYFGINRRCTEKHLKKITTTVHCTNLIFTERTHRELDDNFSQFFQNLLQVLSHCHHLVTLFMLFVPLAVMAITRTYSQNSNQGKQDSHFEPVGVFSLECFLYVLHPLCERTFFDKI